MASPCRRCPLLEHALLLPATWLAHCLVSWPPLSLCLHPSALHLPTASAGGHQPHRQPRQSRSGNSGQRFVISTCGSHGQPCQRLAVAARSSWCHSHLQPGADPQRGGSGL